MSLTYKPHTPGRVVRRTVAIAAALVLGVSSLAACSSAAGDPKEITFLSWDNAATMDPLIAEFEKENPGYTVNVQYAPPVAEYIQKLQTQLSSGSAPDVFIITAENKKQLIDGALVADLSGEPFVDNLADSAKQTYTRDGGVYGAAISSWAGGILVNKDILAEAGVTKFPTTWDGFIDLGKDLKASGYTPYLEPVDSVNVTLSALLGMTNESYDGTMDQQIWDGQLTFEEAWTPDVEAWYRLFTEGILDASAVGLKYDQMVQEFQQGKVAMISNASWGFGGVKAGAPDLNMEFYAVPGGGDGESYWQGAVAPGLALNAKAKNPDAAKVFIDWYSTDGVETYQELLGVLTTTADFEPPLEPELEVMSADVRDGRFYLPTVNWIDNNDVLATEAAALLQQLAAGQISPEDVGAGLDAKLASAQ